MNINVKNNLKKAFRLNEHMLRHCYAKMSGKQLNVFLAICINEGQTITDYSEATDNALITTSKYIKMFSVYQVGSEKGLGLIEYRFHPENGKMKCVYLTEKGRELADVLAGYLD